MKSWMVMLVTWVIILQSPVRAAVTTYTLDLKDPTAKKYADFLDEIRNDVTQPGLHYGGTNLPVMQKKPNPNFIRINLEAPTGTVSLAVHRQNLYVLAYLAKNENDIFRAYYFDDIMITSADIDNVFPEAQGVGNHEQIKFGPQYEQLEGAARMTRIEAGLGIKKLTEYMEPVIKMVHDETTKATEARFLLLAVEMVAEATRFKFIQQLVVDKFPKDTDIDYKVILLETRWKVISNAIRRKLREHRIFDPPLVLSVVGFPPWEVRYVDELNMGILLYVGMPQTWIIIGLLLFVLSAVLLLIYYVRFTNAKSHDVKKTN